MLENFLKLINSEKLINSILEIHKASNTIWTNEVRVIRYITDHGIEHSNRLMNLAMNIINLNDGKKLTEQEIYLLLAGIFLHDIGMQCDPVKHSEIKELASKRYGAVFDLNFTSKTSVDFNIEEQKCIRSNHQYLSAAWIEYARKKGDTILAPAISTVPDNLVKDLIDICLYHTQLDISKCDLKLQYITGRKQLVATILRLSDELDIDSDRINLETVKNFSLDPQNSFYWWLHNQTCIEFTPKNSIKLTISLHPEDMKEYGKYIREIYIEGFCKKNSHLIDILVNNNFNISINVQSNVIENEFTEKLPNEIVYSFFSAVTKGNYTLIESDKDSIQAAWDAVSANDFYYKQYSTFISCQIVGNYIRRNVIKRIIIGSNSRSSVIMSYPIIHLCRHIQGLSAQDLFKIIYFRVNGDDITSSLDMHYSMEGYNIKVNSNVKISVSDNYIIESQYEIIVPTTDLDYLNKVYRPCKKYNITYLLSNDDYALNVYGFGSSLPTKKIFINGVSLEFNDWILPGNGAIITMHKKVNI